MARLSDIIEEFIKEMMKESQQNILEIQRNELANTFNCAPSQINYVLTTRFTTDRGYYIESKRGGGGCIKITRINIDKNDHIKNAIWNNIGDRVTEQEANSYISVFLDRGYITSREAILIGSAISDKTLALDDEIRDQLRARILKTILITIID